MKQNMKNRVNSPNMLFSQLAAEKKKSITALCLIAVMVFMWVRVLGRKTPETAEAAMMLEEAAGGQLNSELKISFIELPNVEGRNDVLTRDFFAADGWQSFLRDGEGENLTGYEKVNIVSRDDREGVARQVAGKLKLEAIGLGENHQAFINGKLLSVGDKLPVSDGVNTYECEVIGIEESTVFIRCGQAEITLKLTQRSVVDY